MSGKVTSFFQEIEVTPTVTAGAYSANTQVGGIQTLTSATLGLNSASTLISIVVTDVGKQSAALTVFFFRNLPTVTSVDNAALDISDAQMAANCIGAIAIPAANYQTVSLNSVATVPASSCGLYLKSTETNGTLYAVVKTTGTPTYASTTDLVFKYSFIQD